MYQINFKFCKGNTKGRRRGGRGAVPAPKENVSKNRCTLRRRVSPFSLHLGFPSALSFLTHPHPAPIFARPHRKSSLKLFMETVHATLIIYYVLWCAQPTKKLLFSTLNVEIISFSFFTSIYTSGRLVTDRNSYLQPARSKRPVGKLED